MAANTIELLRPLYSTVFGPFLGVHLYLLSIPEAPFVFILGPYFYMLLCAALPCLGAWLIFILASRGGTLAGLLIAAAFLLNPLTLEMADMPIYGFQYDLYALACLPLLIAAIELGWSLKRIVLIFLLGLAVKEEMFIAIGCICIYFALQTSKRRIAIALGTCALLYGVAAAMVINNHAPKVAFAPTIEAQNRLEQVGLPNALRSLITWPNNSALQPVQALSERAGPSAWIVALLSAWPGVLMAAYTGLIHKIGLFLPSLLWKAPYIWAIWWSFTALHLGRLQTNSHRKVGLALSALLLVLSVSALLGSASAALKVVTFQSRDSTTRNQLTKGFDVVKKLKRRDASLNQMLEQLDPKAIILPPETPGFIMVNRHRGIHRHAAPGLNHILVERLPLPFNSPEVAQRLTAGMPVAFESPEMQVVAYGFPTSSNDLTGDCHQTTCEVYIPHAGQYNLQAVYTKRGPAWPACTGYALYLNGTATPNPVLCLPTLFHSRSKASFGWLGSFPLSAGQNSISIRADETTVLYQLIAAPIAGVP